MRIGIDLSGTKTEIMCLSDTGEELLRKRFPSPQGNYDQTVASIRKIILDAEQELGQQGSVGVGIPGAISKHTGVG